MFKFKNYHVVLIVISLTYLIFSGSKKEKILDMPEFADCLVEVAHREHKSIIIKRQRGDCFESVTDYGVGDISLEPNEKIKSKVPICAVVSFHNSEVDDYSCYFHKLAKEEIRVKCFHIGSMLPFDIDFQVYCKNRDGDSIGE